MPARPPARSGQPAHASRSRRGFAMIEVLVAMFLIAIFMLASAGTQISGAEIPGKAPTTARARLRWPVKS
ncbi:type IV pilus modification PilV family protein [Piscinibacter sakaiensis]|uniref:type IV pilus modification PilV family protein n=1 Tax=Piscinibacter sakaiensis TaxID=1547922 RepID=UPI003AAA5BCA